MRIGFHIGAHSTDGDRLVRSLLRNRETLNDHGVAVPAPGRYRAALRDAAVNLRGAVQSQFDEAALLTAISDTEGTEALFLSNTSFISVPDMSIGDGQLYPRMFKAAWLRNLFPSHEVEFHICVRDPATFLPALYKETGAEPAFADFSGGVDPRRLLWSVPIRQLLQAVPDARLTLWCYEDTPLIWEEIMRDVVGVGPDVHLHGLYDMARMIMDHEGSRAMRSYVQRYRPPDMETRRKTIAAFVEKFGTEDGMEETIEIDGWSEHLMDDLTTLYEEDLIDIAAMDRVRIIA